jgi:hypothetical protein
MKRLLILAIICLLAGGASAKVVGGIAIGANLDNVKEPGFAVQTGVEEKITDKIHTRLLFNKLNFGDAVAVDNIGLTNIIYWGIGTNIDVANRLSGDAETEGGQFGAAVGIELNVKSIGQIVKSSLLDGVGGYVSFDVVTRPEETQYMQFGIGFSFLSQ